MESLVEDIVQDGSHAKEQTPDQTSSSSNTNTHKRRQKSIRVRCKDKRARAQTIAEAMEQQASSEVQGAVAEGDHDLSNATPSSPLPSLLPIQELAYSTAAEDR